MCDREETQGVAIQEIQPHEDSPSESDDSPGFEVWESELTGNRIWHAYDYMMVDQGYYVTEGGNPDLPIAFIPDYEGSEEARWEAACNIADQPERALSSVAPIVVVDLRHYGRRNSTMETPGMIYALIVAPALDECTRRDDFKHPQPFCPVRAAKFAQFIEDRDADEPPTLDEAGKPISVGDIILADGPTYARVLTARAGGLIVKRFAQARYERSYSIEIASDVKLVDRPGCGNSAPRTSNGNRFIIELHPEVKRRLEELAAESSDTLAVFITDCIEGVAVNATDHRGDKLPKMRDKMKHLSRCTVAE